MEINDDGSGFDQPVMENGDLAIFEAGDGYEVRRFGEGAVYAFPGPVSDALWDELRAAGWEDVDL